MKPRILPLFAALSILSSATHAREVYSLRTYQLKSDEKATLFDAAMADFGIPAIRSAGATKVGVFSEKPGTKNSNSATRHVLTVFPSAEAYGKALTHDYEGMDPQGHLPYLLANKEDAAYDRISGSLLLGLKGFPTLVDPDGEGGADRYFELRVYESPSEGKGFLKVEMFNKAEIAIFEDVGLEIVFFGQAVAGGNLPQLTYMLTYENEAAHKTAWDGFRNSPDWKRLKNEERYAETVSNIQSIFLAALPYSEIR